MQNLPKRLYIAATIPASVIVGLGTLAEQSDRLGVAVTTLYVLWFVLFLVFICLSYLRVSQDSDFHRICFYHLIIIGATLAFLGYLHNGNYNAKISFLWTPFTIQVGILLAVGLQECASVVSWRNFRRLLLSFLDGLRLLMGAQDEHLPL
ncbi:hypothetical protein PFICI_04599 [Pestalotiopsis fici W106-1]|uniref:Uncharacterized protein n=1 Tax=Pestalotiopsis fici (strain W106-1 / CGMCC3.15140) TaxID=1229662 RepID=W3X9F2_PESFW|nr:uncharacterized protein PFICI_04599 [Pestalotiopsis fici W106-1]ETS82723.1 hypothetical protein PFICI_04599 [Pestalotiopsis fici W106-1]